MSRGEIQIKFNPAGFAECLQGMDGMVKEEAEKIISRISGPGQYTVEVVHEPRFHDSAYGVARPVAIAVAIARISADRKGSADEAENKSMSKAVSG